MYKCKNIKIIYLCRIAHDYLCNIKISRTGDSDRSQVLIIDMLSMMRIFSLSLLLRFLVYLKL